MLSLLILLISFSNAWAQDAVDSDSGNFDTYETIVEQLRTTTKAPAPDDILDPFSQVLIHTGVGFVNSRLTMSHQKTKRTGSLSGVEASLGIDLFTPRWAAEGSVRSFGETHTSAGNVSLQEFDLRLIHSPQISDSWRFRAGFGLSARYLELHKSKKADLIADKYSTPASIFLAGFEGYFTQKVSLGGDLSYRAKLIGDTIDDNAVDANVRVAFHF